MSVRSSVTRRRVVVLVALVVAVSTGCSVTQVQYWFAFKAHRQVSVADARTFADRLNAKLPAGCDENYSGCVPNNASVVHCIDAPGEGPAVTGPVTVKAWDHFGLDPDHDKSACPNSPIGVVAINQRLDGIVVSGWALDRDTSAPITVTVSDGSNATSVLANGDRADLASSFPGLGTAHGFSAKLAAGPGVHQICVTGVNQGSGADAQLLCKSITVVAVTNQVITNADSTASLALLEGAEAEPSGLHVWGFVNGGGSPKIILPAPNGTQAGADLGQRIPLATIVSLSDRPDVRAAYPEVIFPVGFDLVIPGSFNPNAAVCLAEQPVFTQYAVACRLIGH